MGKSRGKGKWLPLLIAGLLTAASACGNDDLAQPPGETETPGGQQEFPAEPPESTPETPDDQGVDSPGIPEIDQENGTGDSLEGSSGEEPPAEEPLPEGEGDDTDNDH